MLKFAIVNLFLLVGLILNGCNIGNIGGIKGSGTVKSEIRNVSGFKKIKAENALTIEIIVQKDFSVAIEADDNLLPLIITEVSGDTLKISSKEKFSTKNNLTIKISMPELVDLNVSGATSATVSGVKTESLKLDASGASKIKISGEVKNLNANASGASGIDAENLKTENAEVEASGASSATVAPTGDLNANASGASGIIYAGEPKNIKQDASGMSSVKKK